MNPPRVQRLTMSSKRQSTSSISRSHLELINGKNCSSRQPSPKERLFELTWSKFASFVVYCLCTTGLICQFVSQTKNYLEFATVVRTKFDRNVIIDVPAVTFCVPFAIKAKYLYLKTEEVVSDNGEILVDEGLESNSGSDAGFDEGNHAKPNLTTQDLIDHQEAIFNRLSIQKMLASNLTMVIRNGSDRCCIRDYQKKASNLADFQLQPCEQLGNKRILETIRNLSKCFTYFSRFDGFYGCETLKFQSVGFINISINLSDVFDGDTQKLMYNEPMYMALHAQNGLPSWSEFR